MTSQTVGFDSQVGPRTLPHESREGYLPKH